LVSGQIVEEWSQLHQRRIVGNASFGRLVVVRQPGLLVVLLRRLLVELLVVLLVELLVVLLVELLVVLLRLLVGQLVVLLRLLVGLLVELLLEPLLVFVLQLGLQLVELGVVRQLQLVVVLQVVVVGDVLPQLVVLEVVVVVLAVLEVVFGLLVFVFHVVGSLLQFDADAPSDHVLVVGDALLQFDSDVPSDHVLVGDALPPCGHVVVLVLGACGSFLLGHAHALVAIDVVALPFALVELLVLHPIDGFPLAFAPIGVAGSLFQW